MPSHGAGVKTGLGKDDGGFASKLDLMPHLPVSRRAALWLPPIVYMMVIYHFSSESQPLPALTQHVWDKLLHTAEYGGLAVLVCRALLGEGLGWLAAIAGAIVAASLYGASDEWHQSFVPMRDASVRDWIADTLGGAAGATMYGMGWMKGRRVKTERPPSG
jgi:VanZ family protein